MMQHMLASRLATTFAFDTNEFVDGKSNEYFLSPIILQNFDLLICAKVRGWSKLIILTVHILMNGCDSIFLYLTQYPV